MGAIAFLVYAVLIAGGLITVFFLIRNKTQGKLLAFFVEKDKTLKYFLFAPRGKFFKFAKDDEMYLIDPECVMLVRYPFGMPKFIQQIIPCLIYTKNVPQPLSPKEISIVPKGLTAKEISSSVSENIIKGIVKGVEEGEAKPRIPVWILPAVSVLLTCVMAIMVWSMNAKIDAVANLIKVVTP